MSDDAIGYDPATDFELWRRMFEAIVSSAIAVVPGAYGNSLEDLVDDADHLAELAVIVVKCRAAQSNTKP